MSYLFTKNQEITNDSGNPIPSEIIHEGSVISSSNPLPVQFSNASINIGAEVEISNDVGNPVPVSGTISVDNLPAFPTVQTVDGTVIVGNGVEQAIPVFVSNNITIDNLSANQTISGTVGLDSATLISLENINANVTGTVSIDNLPAIQTVQGIVSLDSVSLSALETITAVVTFPEVQTVQGIVSLDSVSLSALETITAVVTFPEVQTVQGTVSLDSTSLAALETITAVVTFPEVQTVQGTVSLDSASLSALENITVEVSSTISIDNLPAIQVVQGTVSLDSASLLALEDINVTVNNFPATQDVSGTVSIDNLPAIQTVQGTVSLDSASLSALENITVEVSSSITVDNFPAVQVVSLDSESKQALEFITAVVAFPEVQTVQGTVSLDSTSLSALENITVEVSSTVSIDNFPTIQTVQGTVSLDSASLLALEDINVTVSNFPAIQDVSGTVSINNFPAIQTVQGTMSLDSVSLSALETITAVVTFPEIQTVQGTVSLDSSSRIALENITVEVSNFPAIQDVSGTVSIDNLPAIQTVQGTVSLDSVSLSALETITAVVTFPAIQTVTLDSSSRDALENITAEVSNFPAVQTIDGSVSISNFPSNQIVSLDSSSRAALETITALVSFPEVQTVQGTVSLDSTSLSALENITAEVSNFPAVQTVSGTVIIGNESSAPVPVTVSSDISISNFPSVQTVSLDSSSRDALENITATVAFPSTQIVSLDSSSRDALENITVEVSNFPAVQTVDGTVVIGNGLESPVPVVVGGDISINNFPAVQTVDGTVGLDSNSLSALENITATVSNFPAIQTVSLDSSSRNALENITVDTISNPVTIQDGGNSITVDGEVSITSLPEVEIKNDSGNPISISRNNTTNSQLNPIFVKGASDATFFDPAQLDAFGRLRVSNPHTLFESSFRYTDSLYRWNQKTVGTASSTIDVNASVINLSVGSIVNDSVIRETERVFGYQPGKSLLILSTFTMSPAKENLRQRVGYFGKDNGIYFEVDGTQVSIVKRSSSGGSIQETKVLQSNWLNDPLDGTGRSGITLDPSKSQIFWTDIEWLGVGSVRTGFIINGKYIICHTFHHANSIESTYMTTASLPLRYEITNTGNTSGNSTLKQICSTVISEGGYNPAIVTQSASTPLSGKNLSVGISNPMVSIRLRSGKTDGIVIPKEVNLYGLQSAAYKYRIIKDGILSNPSWQIADSSQIAEYDLDADSIQGGIVIYEGLFKGQSNVNPISLSEIFENSVQLTRGIIENDSAGDTFSITLEPTTNNDDAIVSLSWQSHNA